MAVITKITTQKHSDDRLNIFLDDGSGEKYAFSVDQDVFIRFNLQKGKELDEFDIHEIQFGDEIKKAYNSSLEYLSYRMRSVKEVEDHLRKKEYQEEIIQDVMSKLKENKYVDDLAFAIAYVRTQWQTNGKGPVVIRRELAEKGVNEQFIQEVLSAYRQDEQVEVAVTHAEKLLKKNHKISTTLLKNKVEQHLLRKGFAYQIISIVLEDVQFEQEDSVEMDNLRRQAEKAKRKYEKEEPYLYRQKMKQFLYRKGFSIEMIENYLNEDNSEGDYFDA
ncbi:recombination regulator RecX [Metabacillus malikii]|uniref:Regulatory protein RecX n=1 Tax=Metabacillus malikii TaxID=1504265 RepID=A0ABT9ZIK4_9BACI|nr:recombination regulator RecX [Metabacillus malikii]MDQ0231739.1 regulatory protein [Metabacillus malikii]